MMSNPHVVLHRQARAPALSRSVPVAPGQNKCVLAAGEMLSDPIFLSKMIACDTVSAYFLQTVTCR